MINSKKMINVGLIGYGHWGPNLLRNLIENPNFSSVALAESRLERREHARNIYSQIKFFEQGNDLINDPNIDAVVIACKVDAHYLLARKALEAGKHVLVEKPLCTERFQALDLIKIAEQKKLTLMVDHTLVFDGNVRKIKELYNSGELGHVSYYDAVRVNYGIFQPDVSVLWDLAPHDLAVMDYIFDEEPIKIQAGGFCHVNKNINDVAFLTLYFASKRIAHFKFSWVWPYKSRYSLIRGSKKVALWDDLATDQKLKIYDYHLDFNKTGKVVVPKCKKGDVLAPLVDNTPPLAGVIDHFAQVILGRDKSLMDGHKGLRILKILEIAEQQINKNLNEVGLELD